MKAAIGHPLGASVYSEGVNLRWVATHRTPVERQREQCLTRGVLKAHGEAPTFGGSPVASRRQEPWGRWIDTSLASPHDIGDGADALEITGFTYRLPPRSTAFPVSPLGVTDP